VSPLARNRKFESISLQRGVACEPEDDIDIPVRRVGFVAQNERVVFRVSAYRLLSPSAPYSGPSNLAFSETSSQLTPPSARPDTIEHIVLEFDQPQLIMLIALAVAALRCWPVWVRRMI
jgi:hypothetical protein